MRRLAPARLSRPRAGYLDLDLPSGRSQSAQGDLRERPGRDQVLLQSRPGYRVSPSGSSKDLPGSRRGRMRPDPIDSPAAFVGKRLDGQSELFLERATNGAMHGVRLPASRERRFVTGRITAKNFRSVAATCTAFYPARSIRIPHKKESYPGLHEAIIDPATWQSVQNRLGSTSRDHASVAPAGGRAEPVGGPAGRCRGKAFSLSHGSK
jgi:hypothetical protein